MDEEVHAMSIEVGITLERFIIEEQRTHPGARGEFSGLLSQITLAGKIISREVNKAGLAEILGLTGRKNVHGEDVQMLDMFAHETFVATMDHSGYLCIMASEELEGAIEIPPEYPCGSYVLLFDPLDGSSNIDVNVNIGSIFSILKRRSRGTPRGTLDDCLQKGVRQVGAGYLVYGSSTMFVYTTGFGVHGFTLDPSLGEFLLSHPHIQIPDRSGFYSVNEGNSSYWDEGTSAYVEYLKTPSADKRRPYSARYIGSLVADFHRNLLKGGVFLYPGDRKHENGKLRLLYEANPLAFIAEQAGGAASTGLQRILDVEPVNLHQRTPLIIGNKEDVALYEAYRQGKRRVPASGGG
jgi:fructose-1,6-bisphosphatase I